MRSKQQSGHILMAGPTSDFKTSIYVIRARSVEEAQCIAEEDPLVKAVPESMITIYEWDVHHILGVGVFAAEGAFAEKGGTLAA
jgi:YCII-related domain.